MVCSLGLRIKIELIVRKTLEISEQVFLKIRELIELFPLETLKIIVCLKQRWLVYQR